MSFGAISLRAVLEEHLPSGATGLVVGVSGGADSACLLAAVAQLGSPCPIRGLNVRAVHIDHGLQPAAAALRAAGEALCRQLRIPLATISVAVDLAGGASIEAAAREARYRALALALRDRRMPADRAPRAGPGRDAAAAAAARCRPQGPLLHAAAAGRSGRAGICARSSTSRSGMCGLSAALRESPRSRIR